MDRIDEISMLRVVDGMGAVLLCSSIPHGAKDRLVPSEPIHAEALAGVGSVVTIDTDTLVVINDPATLTALSSWLAMASLWLKKCQLEDDMDGDYEEAN